MNDETSAIDLHAYTRQGIALVNQGRLAEALPYFEEFVRSLPGVAHGYNNLANVFLFMGRYADAIAHSNMVHLLGGQGRYKDALAWAKRAIEPDPRQAEAHAAHSAVCSPLNRVEEALASSRQALQLNPQPAEAHLNHATAYLKLG